MAHSETQTLGGVWMPQVTVAERFGWPAGYTAAGIAATKILFDA
jgi:hypothetical protein